jgi:hypothetical protein
MTSTAGRPRPGWLGKPEVTRLIVSLLDSLLGDPSGVKDIHLVEASIHPRPGGDFALADLSSRARLWLLTVACFGVLLVISSMVALNTALPDIAIATSATQTQLTWIVDSYTLVLACLLLPAGALGDRYGRRGAMLVGLAIFGAASLVAAVLSNPMIVIISRGVAGDAVIDHRGLPERSAQQGSRYLGRGGRIRRRHRDARIWRPAELLVLALDLLGLRRRGADHLDPDPDHREFARG